MNTPAPARLSAFAAGRRPLFSALLVCVLALPGCFTQRMGTEVPRDAMIVGGGKVMTYTAVTDGILFLVDQRDLVASQTIKTGEVYNVNGAVELGNGTTVDLIESRLYFLPHDDQAFVEEEEEHETHHGHEAHGDHDDLHDALDPAEDHAEEAAEDHGKSGATRGRDLPGFDQLEETLGQNQGKTTQDAVTQVPTK